MRNAAGVVRVAVEVERQLAGHAQPVVVNAPPLLALPFPEAVAGSEEPAAGVVLLGLGRGDADVLIEGAGRVGVAGAAARDGAQEAVFEREVERLFEDFVAALARVAAPE